MENLRRILDQTAERIVVSGTRTESATLCALSAATRHLAPGAAAALIDWGGAEIVRLRAFGIVHGLVLRELDGPGRNRLLGELTGQVVAPRSARPGDLSRRAAARPSRRRTPACPGPRSRSRTSS